MPKPTPPKTSRYLPIWNKLKVEKECKVVAETRFHRTIIKMIKNRRDKDLEYRYLCSEHGVKESIKVSVSGNTITFKLIRTLSLGERL